MAVAFNQLIALFSGTTLATSASYTPLAGDTVLNFGVDPNTGTASLTQSSSQGSMAVVALSGHNNFNDTDTDTWALWAVQNLSPVPSTVSVSGPTSDPLFGIGLDYSGAAGVSNGLGTVTAAPGTGAGAVLGASASAAVGAVLVALVVQLSSIDNGTTISSANGSPATRYAGNGILSAPDTASIFEYAGSGSAFTPTFTVSKGAGTWLVLQGIVNAAVTSADIFSGLDTYGWPEAPAPQQTAMSRGIVAMNTFPAAAVYQPKNRTQIQTVQRIIQI